MLRPITIGVLSIIIWGKHDKAIADLDKAIELDSNYALAYNNRGVAYGDMGEYNRAIADFDKAIELDSDYAVAYYNRGSMYLILQNWAKARSDLVFARESGMDIADEFLLIPEELLHLKRSTTSPYQTTLRICWGEGSKLQVNCKEVK